MTRRKVSQAKRHETGRPAAKKNAGGRGRAIAIVLGAVAAAAIAAFIITGDGGEPVSSDTVGVTVTGTPLPLFEEGADPAVGMAAPALSGEDLEGRPASISNDERPKVLIFLAHWCPHCQREVPLLQSWLNQQGMPEGVDLYSIATAIDPSQPNYPPADWLAREGWTVPVLVDDAEDGAATAYGLSGFPFWVFVDANGNVASRTTGELTIDQLQGYLASISSQAAVP